MGSTGSKSSGFRFMSSPEDQTEVVSKMQESTNSDKSSSEDYYQFEDEHSNDKWEDKQYAGYGKKTERFFDSHSNYKDIIANMSDADNGAFNNEWIVGNFTYGQQYEGFHNMDKADQDATRAFDRALDQATLDTGIQVHRLAGWELINDGSSNPLTIEQIQSMIKSGRVINSIGNLSTSAAKEGLTVGNYDKEVDYAIRIPGGTKGAGMYIGSDFNEEWGNGQREFMMNRDIYLKPVEVRDNGLNSYKGANPNTGRYTVVLEYVGRHEHRYKKEDYKDIKLK